MTGRKARVVRQGRGWASQPRAKPESGEMEALNVTERNAFMDGKKLVAIISDAASTGISLHADARRANQRSAPRYVLLCTDVGGEARFGSSVARKLEAMGALTKGDRRAEIGSLDTFNLDTAWGRKALKALLAATYAGDSP